MQKCYKAILLYKKPVKELSISPVRFLFWPYPDGYIRAKLSDAQVEQIRDWHEIGGFGYKKIVKMVKAEFGLTVHRITVREICLYLKRATTASSYRTRIVNLKPGETLKIKGISTFRCPRVD